MRPPESFISQPIRSMQTMLRVIAEAENRIPTVIPDGIYGQTTLQAVTEFQRSVGLPVTGITDKKTWDEIEKKYEESLLQVGPAEPIEIIFNPGQVYRMGDNGAYIYLMQTLLIWLSKDHDDITAPEHTGEFDAATEQALSAFQSLAGLEPTGQLDRITWKNLSKQFTLNAHHHANRNIIAIS